MGRISAIKFEFAGKAATLPGARINEMLGVCRKLNTPMALAAGLLTGFLAGFGTDLVLGFVGG